MHENILLPYLAKLDSLPGAGAKSQAALSRLVGGERVLDLLLHLPSRWTDRSRRISIAQAVADANITLCARVISISPGRGAAPTRVLVEDDSGQLDLVFFRASAGWMRQRFRRGEEIIISGKIEQFRGQKQIIHPDHILDPRKDPPLPPVEAHYRLGCGITQRQLGKWIAAALDTIPDLPEWQQNNRPGFREALITLHRPKHFDPDAFEHARTRLAHDEALAREIAVRRARKARDIAKSIAMPAANDAVRTMLNSLPFAPTKAQQRAFAEISADMSATRPMRRMLQGDVGSGKTLVGALAIAQAASNGMRSAIMSPSEILARQQARALDAFLRPAGFNCAAMTGSDKGTARQRILSAFASGEIHALSGTQALFRSQTKFPDLGLIIIDEQHRFGVADRLKLAATGDSPHMLAMSATPIPRTMLMALHGDLDLSVLDEKPKGRPDIITRAVPDTRMPEVLKAIGKAIERKEKAFWICPALDANDEATVMARHQRLSDMLNPPPALIHGRMSRQEAEDALERFRHGDAGLLVATTVVEVGVDIPEATIMVIESAERFGLAQLHQLRGRVGRGQQQSACLLIYKPPLSETAAARIDALRQHDDGFTIAETDYKLRGPGDLLGSRQSGLPDFKVLDLSRDAHILETARANAATTEQSTHAGLLEKLMTPGDKNA